MSKNQQANNKCANMLLEEYYYRFFREGSDSRPLEIIITPQCNLKCSYCYLWKNKDNLFSNSCPDNQTLLANFDLILAWLEKNKFHPPLELFSGEFFAQSIGYQILEKICQHQATIAAELRVPYILVATNFTFICSDELIEKVDSYRDRLKELGITLFLSASVDGKYIESNRSYDQNLDIEMDVVRDDAYYDKLFDYCLKHNICFHPMIYSRHIDKWKDNFNWFMEQFAKRGVHPWGFYLLEVRNEEWTRDEIYKFQDFLRFLYNKMWHECDCDKEKYVNRLFDFSQNFNITNAPAWGGDRGLSCSVQSALCMRLDDLSLPLCHRTGYKNLLIGQWTPDDEEILHFESKNVELFASILGAQVSALPTCNGCMLNAICIGQCLGACYESNKNLFVPIPSVCALEHAKTMVFIEQALEYQVYNDIIKRMTPIKAEQLNDLRRKYFAEFHSSLQ